MEPLILPVHGTHPQIPESTFLAPNCTVVGDVSMGEGCSIWFNAVVRGQGAVEVSLRDGLAAVVMGLAAQESARTGQAIDLTRGDYDLSVLLNFGVA